MLQHNGTKTLGDTRLAVGLLTTILSKGLDHDMNMANGKIKNKSM